MGQRNSNLGLGGKKQQLQVTFDEDQPVPALPPFTHSAVSYIILESCQILHNHNFESDFCFLMRVVPASGDRRCNTLDMMI